MQPWRTLDEAVTPDGKLTLRQRGEKDFLLSLDQRVLMSSMLHRSETSLAELAHERIRDVKAPRVLTAGLGLGFTLRALLDVLPKRASVEVRELHEVVVRWCDGPLASVHGHATRDPRVKVVVGDVMDAVRAAAADPRLRYDAIVVDLMEGPNRARAYALGHLYGPRALEAVRAALAPGGIYAVWGEDDDPTFVEKLMHLGFDARRVFVGKGPKHVVYLAQPAARARGGVLAHGGDAPPEPRRREPPPRGPTRPKRKPTR